MRESRIAESLLRGFISDPHLEDAIFGDLAEEQHQRAESSGAGPARAWYRRQVVRSVPHLLRHWWLQQTPGQTVRTVARVTFTLVLVMSGTVAFGGTSPDTVTLLVAGGLWAAAGGFSLAWTTPSGAPMCPATLLGLSLIPASVAASGLLAPPGPTTWLLALAPTILLALSISGGMVAAMLRSTLSAHDSPSATDPSTPGKTMKTTGSTLRLLARPILAAATLLMVPLVAMQFTAEVNWTLFDFVVMGVLIVGTGVTFELALRKGATIGYRAAAGVALASAFLLVWVNLAVGIMGSSAHEANVLYFGVLAVGGVGSLVARFHPRGMVRAMVATALAHTGVGVTALIAGWGSPVHVVGLTVMFALLFLASAWLFQSAADQGAGGLGGRRAQPCASGS